MPVPSSINDLSTTASLNSPAGSESPGILDDVQRAHAAFIRQVYDFQTALLGSDSANKSAARAALGVDMQHGQCRLTKSGSNLLLSPYNGNKLIINGVMQSIPAAGVSLAPTGLSATTLYYIYAYMNSGAMMLEASTTAYAADATTGINIKSGDATRTYVGVAYVKTAATFADSATQRFVRSAFNEPAVVLSNVISGANVSYSVATYAEVTTGIRCELCLLPGETLDAEASGTVSNNGAGNSVYTGIGFDSATTPETGVSGSTDAFGGSAVPMAVNAKKFGLAAGYHYVTLIGKPNAGTATWVGTTVGAQACQLSVTVLK